MRAVLISSECEPWAKTGGLADVVDALARALGRLPDEPERPVEVFLPRYRSVPLPEAVGRRRLRVPDPLGSDGMTELSILDVEADGYRLRLIDHPPAFDRDGFYGDANGDYPDDPWRFGLFCRAALEAVRTEDRPVDVLSLHEWQACPTVLYRDTAHAADPVIGRAAVTLTLHNLAYHGWTPRDRLAQFLFPAERAAVVPAGADGLDLLRAGIERAELVNTVSRGYAAEVLTPEYGMGLDDVLARRRDRFLGIRNGLDMAVWDPATDADVAATYSAADLAGKAVCRRDLLSRVGMDPDAAGPVLGMIGRLDPQKGFDLLAGAAERLVDAGARLVVLGSGQPDLVAGLRDLAAAEPTRIALLERFDRVLARRIYAGADFFLMPSRFEPCGQGQMIALRYGTPPVVRRTGGLADTVVDVDAEPATGTGFVFDEATPEAFLAACERAMARFEAGGPDWTALLRRGMAVDWSWVTGPAREYEAMYERAVALRRAG
ncbi:MAG TPA: glycogen/starch synthase [Candidatus Limnocylindrales bacterium]